MAPCRNYQVCVDGWVEYYNSQSLSLFSVLGFCILVILSELARWRLGGRLKETGIMECDVGSFNQRARRLFLQRMVERTRRH